MQSTATQTRFSQDAFDAFVAPRGEPDWLLDLRRIAWDTFQQLHMPSRGEEEWMRTDLRLFHLDRFGLPGDLPATARLPAALLTHGVDLAGHDVSLNSRRAGGQVDPALANRGVLFGSLDRLVIDHGEVVRPYLARQIIAPATDKFAALHAACWSGGTLLYVPRGVTVERPLHVLNGLTACGVDTSKTLVILEEGAEATLLAETAGGDGEPALHCGAIEIFVGPGARLRYVNLQNWGSGVWHFAHQKALVDRDARLQWTIGALGSRLAQVNQHVILTGPGAEVQVNGVMFTEGKQQLSYNTLQHHQAEHCRSDLLYKGALQDRSRIVWRGMIKVDKGAEDRRLPAQR